jgi:ribose 5-phosphate isomerase B
MRVVFGSDHAGLELKNHLLDVVRSWGHEVLDVGTNTTDSVSYADYGRKAAEVVARGEADRAILVCGTGLGISLAANSVNGVRCVVCSEPFTAKLSRNHNNTNALAVGARVIAPPFAEMIASVWLSEDFEGGRHQGRIDSIDRMKLDGSC